MAEPSRRVARTSGLLGGAVLGLTVLTGCGGSGTSDAVLSGFSEVDGDGLHGAVLDSPYTWPEGALLDTDGDAVDLRAELDEPLTLVFFGYSRCPDICQAVMADLASANARLDDSLADDVATWFVTTDPARDDPATLGAYLERFDPEFRGFTGPLPDIVEVAGAVHVPIERGKRLPSGGYEVSHGTPILGVTRDGTVPVVWTEGTSAAKLAEDIETILTDGVPAPEGGG